MVTSKKSVAHLDSSSQMMTRPPFHFLPTKEKAETTMKNVDSSHPLPPFTNPISRRFFREPSIILEAYHSHTTQRMEKDGELYYGPFGRDAIT